MGQFEMIQSFALRHNVSARRYGHSVSLSAIELNGTDIRVHVVMHGRGKYTAVYQHESDLDRNSVERTWDSVESTFKNGVSLSFEEVTGLWRNTNGRMRLSKDFYAHGYDEEVFDRAILSACGELVRIKTTLLLILDVGGEVAPDSGSLFGAETDSKSLSVKKTGGFADVAGLDDLKLKLSDEVIWPLANRAKAVRYKITPPSGMLLYGPPGCGKTFFARKLAEETGFSFKMVFPSDIGGMIIHETQGKVARLFEEAASEAPCIICFDEIDSMIPRRTSTPGLEYQNTEVNEFLVQMSSCGEKGIFVIGTTNNMELIDPAALRTGRLDYHVEIPRPDAQQRERLFRKSMDGRPACVNIDYEALARMSSGLTASDISFVVNGAALAAARADKPVSFENLSQSLSRWHSSRKTQDELTSGDEKVMEEDIFAGIPMLPKKVIKS